MLTTHEAVILTNFHIDWTKIVNFLLKVNFLDCPIFLHLMAIEGFSPPPSPYYQLLERGFARLGRVNKIIAANLVLLANS